MPAIDITGQTFGFLTALHRVPDKRPRWLCACVCGKQKEVAASHLRSGKIRSCGHLIAEATRRRCTKHGLKPRRAATDPTYSTWCAMWTRCTNSKQRGWERYGGRGIKVCDRWKDFAAFLEDMGERPKGCTLDRVDINGDYSPENCRWANVWQQARNRRGSLHVTYNGQTKPLAQWAEELGMVYTTLYNRLYRYGWSIDRAMKS